MQATQPALSTTEQYRPQLLPSPREIPTDSPLGHNEDPFDIFANEPNDIDISHSIPHDSSLGVFPDTSRSLIDSNKKPNNEFHLDPALTYDSRSSRPAVRTPFDIELPQSTMMDPERLRMPATPSLTPSRGSIRRPSTDDFRWDDASKRDRDRRHSSIMENTHDGMPARGGQTILHLAAIHGSDTMIRSFLRRGIDPDAVDDEGSSALHYATLRGHENVVSTLLQGGANIETRDGMGRTALHLAVEKDQMEIAMLLLHNGADMKATVNRSLRK